MVQRIIRLLRNPMVQRALAWALPIFIAWLLSKLDKKSAQKPSKRTKKRT